MEGLDNIEYFRHGQIDKQKWDACINQASNGLVYAYSFYLDRMATQWDALIWNDYEAVMPLTWNSKYGIRYLYQPFLAAQLGVFGKNITPDITESFLSAIPPSFRYIDISLNASCKTEHIAVSKRRNFILHLQKPYETLSARYKENIQRNIKKAKDCIIKKDIDAELIIDLAVKQMKEQGQAEKDNITRFKNLYPEMQSRGMMVTYGVYSAEEQLLASCIFFLSHKRAFYILVGNHPAGKNTGASHALIDAFIKDHAGKDLWLDFEGSDIPGLAQFYASFGATEEPYYALKENRLPFYLKWMKK